MRYWSTPPHATIEQTRDWLAATIAIALREGEDFVVEHDGSVIGKAGLYRFPETGFIFHLTPGAGASPPRRCAW